MSMIQLQYNPALKYTKTIVHGDFYSYIEQQEEDTWFTTKQRPWNQVSCLTNPIYFSVVAPVVLGVFNCLNRISTSHSSEV